MFDLDAILEQLIIDEGLRLKPYLDTVGKWTIGIGRNLSDKGITKEEAKTLCRNDIYDAYRELKKYKFANEIDDTQRLSALVNMMFNLGEPRFSGFKQMIAALNEHNWARAAECALDSKWATQVGQRANRIAHDIQFGSKISG